MLKVARFKFVYQKQDSLLCVEEYIIHNDNTEEVSRI